MSLYTLTFRLLFLLNIYQIIVSKHTKQKDFFRHQLFYIGSLTFATKLFSKFFWFSKYLKTNNNNIILRCFFLEINSRTAIRLIWIWKDASEACCSIFTKVASFPLRYQILTLTPVDFSVLYYFRMTIISF